MGMKFESKYNGTLVVKSHRLLHDNHFEIFRNRANSLSGMVIIGKLLTILDPKVNKVMAISCYTLVCLAGIPGDKKACRAMIIPTLCKKGEHGASLHPTKPKRSHIYSCLWGVQRCETPSANYLGGKKKKRKEGETAQTVRTVPTSMKENEAHWLKKP
eukprot:1150050-Pelagomonas_calceolata.AAC.6